MDNGKLKVLIHSNAPWVGTGYGNQTHIFSNLLAEDGHKVLISAYWGLKGHRLNMGENIVVLPGGLDDWGNDMLPLHYTETKPDVMFLLHDIWVLRPDVLDRIPAASWCPVDHDPVPPAVVERLQHVRHPIAMSKFGEKQLRQAGFDPFYIPHGVDTDVFKPIDRAEARRLCMIEDSDFYVVMNAANKGVPSRKSLENVYKAWSVFIRTHPNAVMYVHTLPFETTHGIDLLAMAEFYKIPTKNLQYPDVYRYIQGSFDWQRLNIFYNAADVYLAPSMGEGFGIPVIEAQAAGCPVIVTDFSAQSELCAPGGYKIPIGELDRWFTPQKSEQAWVHPAKILEALEWAYEQKNRQPIRDAARDFARQYDAKRVYKKYLLPVFNQIAEEDNGEPVPGDQAETG